jgi:hypothetical protein
VISPNFGNARIECGIGEVGESLLGSELGPVKVRFRVRLRGRVRARSVGTLRPEASAHERAPLVQRQGVLQRRRSETNTCESGALEIGHQLVSRWLLLSPHLPSRAEKWHLRLFLVPGDNEQSGVRGKPEFRVQSLFELTNSKPTKLAL